jgi:hypothetical protein
VLPRHQDAIANRSAGRNAVFQTRDFPSFWSHCPASRNVSSNSRRNASRSGRYSWYF